MACNKYVHATIIIIQYQYSEQIMNSVRWDRLQSTWTLSRKRKLIILNPVHTICMYGIFRSFVLKMDATGYSEPLVTSYVNEYMMS
jgi:hypothetical protein